MAIVCSGRGARQGHPQTESEQKKYLQACRAILGGPDTAGRRWLVRQLRDDGALYGDQSIGASLPLLGLVWARERLGAEFPGVVCGGYVVGHEPVSEAFCMEVIA